MLPGVQWPFVVAAWQFNSWGLLSGSVLRFRILANKAQIGTPGITDMCMPAYQLLQHTT